MKLDDIANPFDETDRPREGGWLIRLSGLEIAQGKRVPDGYGLAWYLDSEHVAVFAPVPWNRLLGWARRCYVDVRFRVRPDREQLAFQRGVDEGARRAQAQILLIELRCESERRMQVAKAEQLGYDRCIRGLSKFVDNYFPSRGRESQN